MPADRPVTLGPITHHDIGPVAAFLTAHLNARVSPDSWAAAMTPPNSWGQAPNHGFMLTSGQDIVGVYLAFYSTREIDGREVKVCNLAAWCVLDEHRAHSLKLLRAILRQKGYTFTDLSPSGNVVPLNQRLRFTTLDTATAVIPNLPWPRSRTVSVTSDQAVIAAALTGPDRRIFEDHAQAAAARHILIRSGDQTCHVIFRHDRRKRLPIFGSLLHVSNPDLLSRTHRQLSRHLLLEHRVLVTLAELRIAGPAPAGSRLLAQARPRMFKSDELHADRVDYLYSELTNVAW